MSDQSLVSAIKLKAGEYIDNTITEFLPQYNPSIYIIGEEEPKSDSLKPMDAFWWDLRNNRVMMYVNRPSPTNPNALKGHWIDAKSDYPRYVLDDDGAVVGVVRIDRRNKDLVEELDKSVEKKSFKDIVRKAKKK